MAGRSGFASGAAALLAVLLAGTAGAQQGPGIPNIVPGIVTDDAQACVSVANLTQYNWPVTITRKDRGRSTVGVKPREVMRYCAPDRLRPDEYIIITLRSSWLPLGECKLKNRGTMEIFRVKDPDMQSGERTEVKCYEGR
ncbi:hypothetical protein [Ferrovibrio sp.]|uniref:hypothetical protein n=1 Tax=Ferrovibrio sp. TaxID=1917215 RepID=UPI00311E8716